MAFKWDAGDDFSSGSTFLTEPGLYHLVVTGVEETPRKKNGEMINNAAFSVSCGVVQGSVEGQKDKSVDLIFFAPNLGGKDQGKFARKKIDRFLIAVGLLRSDQIGQKGLTINLDDCVGRQFFCKLEKDQDGKYLQISFADIFHIDDPDAAGYPRDEAAIGIIDSGLRWKKSAASTQKQQKPVPVPPSAVDDLDI